MNEKKTFILPDLGEGLPDATIVEWFVKVGDVIRLDEPLVSMETAKAVVEVPTPYSGKVTKLAGAAGDVIVTGKMLAEVELDPTLPQRADAQDTGHHHGAATHAADADTAQVASVGAASVGAASGRESIRAGDGAPTTNAPATTAPATSAAATRTEVLREDSGTVVGAMEASDRVHAEHRPT